MSSLDPDVHLNNPGKTKRRLAGKLQSALLFRMVKLNAQEVNFNNLVLQHGGKLFCARSVYDQLQHPVISESWKKKTQNKAKKTKPVSQVRVCKGQ